MYFSKNPKAGQQASSSRHQENNNNSLLRTGRNLSNSELNALASRNRSGSVGIKKESSMNSKKTAAYPGGASGNGLKYTYTKGPAGGAGTGSSGYGASAGGHSGTFCGECGSEFPVQWAKFCSFCGDRRF